MNDAKMDGEIQALKKIIGTGVPFGLSATQRHLKCGFNHAFTLLGYAFTFGHAERCEESTMLKFI